MALSKKGSRDRRGVDPGSTSSAYYTQNIIISSVSRGRRGVDPSSLLYTAHSNIVSRDRRGVDPGSTARLVPIIQVSDIRLLMIYYI